MTPPENDLRDAVAPQVAEALATFQKQRGYHRPVIEELLIDFGGIVAGLMTTDLAKARADLERVTAELTDYGNHIIDLEFKVFYAEADATRLRALLVDAREALEEFVGHCPHGLNPYLDAACNKARNVIALAALDKAPTPKEPA